MYGFFLDGIPRTMAGVSGYDSGQSRRFAYLSDSRPWTLKGNLELPWFADHPDLVISSMVNMGLEFTFHSTDYLLWQNAKRPAPGEEPVYKPLLLHITKMSLNPTYAIYKTEVPRCLKLPFLGGWGEGGGASSA